MDTKKILTATLTDRAPVNFLENAWPRIASVTGDSYSGHDGAVHDQAREQGELDQYWIRVRRHTDGRVLVYAGVETGWHSDLKQWKGGELLDAGEDIAQTIKRVTRGRMPDWVADECIAELPAERI